MAGGLPKPREKFHKIPNARLAILASMWHPQCVDAMVERARRELLALDVKEANLAIHRVPGSAELPFAARVLFETDSKLDAILAFGVVLKGGTTHDATVIQNVVTGFAAVSARFAKPIINEVIGVVDIADAEARAGDTDWNKGLEAAFTVSELLHWCDSVRAASRETVGFR